MRGEITMKKFLVVMMVLGLVGSAQAALQISLNGAVAGDEITISVSDNIVIGVMSDTADPWAGILEYIPRDSQAAEWVGSVTINPIAGFRATAALAAGYATSWQLSAAAFPGEVPAVAPGEQFTIGFHCLAVGDVVVTLWGDAWDSGPVLDQLTIHQVIPEPVTIGLLGLGGLFLRRRK
jgi:hypothetical protein